MSMGDDGLAVKLIERHSLMLAYHGDLSTVDGWLDRLSPEMVKIHPWLCLARAWVAGFAGNLDASSAWLIAAETALTNLPEDKRSSDERLAGHLAVARAYLTATREDFQLTILLTRQALDTLPLEDQMTRSLATMLLAIAQRSKGEFDLAAHTLDEAFTMSKKAGDIFLTVDVLWERSLLEFMQGKLTKVMASCQEALALIEDVAQQSGSRLLIMGYIYERMSAVHLERYELEAARHYAQESVNLTRKWGQKDALLMAEFSLARVLIASGEEAHALEKLRSVAKMAQDMGGWYYIELKALNADIRLLQWDKISPVEWVRESGIHFEEEPCHQNVIAYFVYVDTLLLENRWEEARYILDRVLEMAKTEQFIHLEIRVNIYQAKLFQAIGDVNQALRIFEHSLMLAKLEGYVYSFIKHGSAIKKLLCKAIDAGLEKEYAEKLLAVMDSNFVGEISTIKVDQGTLMDSLTGRELEVMRLLVNDLPIQKIADQLDIAVGTARTHVKRIYDKLGVHSRFEAITQAKKLKLI